MENWYIPMTLLPGVALLLLSTSNLMVTLSNEINTIIKDQLDNETIIIRKMKQLKLLNFAMVFFYISIACLAIAGVLGGLQIISTNSSSTYISLIGIMIMLFGLFALIRYSTKAVSIRQDQLNLKLNKR